MKVGQFSQYQNTEATRLLGDLFNMIDNLLRLSQASNVGRPGADSEELNTTVLKARQLLEKSSWRPTAGAGG